jgi:hypothetical protein
MSLSRYAFLMTFICSGFTFPQIGHFTLDNAENNAVAMQELEHQLDEPETAIAVGFDHRNNCVRCYAHIINICSSHIVASVTSTPKLYISNLKVPIDSNIVTCVTMMTTTNQMVTLTVSSKTLSWMTATTEATILG